MRLLVIIKGLEIVIKLANFRLRDSSGILFEVYNSEVGFWGCHHLVVNPKHILRLNKPQKYLADSPLKAP